MPKAQTYEGRIDAALERLTRAASHSWRTTPEGQLIEGLGCILSGRSRWWVDEDGLPPTRDYSPSFRPDPRGGYRLVWAPAAVTLPEWPATIGPDVTVERRDSARDWEYGVEITVWTLTGRTPVKVWRGPDGDRRTSADDWTTAKITAEFGGEDEFGPVSDFLLALYDWVDVNVADAEAKALDLIRHDLLAEIARQRGGRAEVVS